MAERDFIEERIGVASADLAGAGRVADRLSWARLLYAVLAIAILAWAGLWTWMWIAGAVAPFAILVGFHGRAVARAEAARGALAAARGAAARMDRDWANIPPLQSIDLDGAGNTAAIRDLDVYGDRSLFRLVDVAQRSVGGATLLRWLLNDPDTLPAIRDRQASVRVLRTRPEYLLESARLCRHGSRPGPSHARLAVFRQWAGRSSQQLSPTLTFFARALTAAFVLAVATAVVSPDLRDRAASIIIILATGQFVVATLGRRHLRARVGEAADLLPELTAVTDVIRAIDAEPPVDGRFGEIQRSLKGDGVEQAFARLSRLFGWDAVHHSPMMHAALNAVVAVDAHLASRIDCWHAEFGPRIPAWIDLVGEAQAITALATLAYENPGWSIPAVHDDQGPMLTARDCGHPMIAPAVCITNQVTLESPASAVVISGSNMSGKTTHLRAVGLNALLALAGGPVCSAEATIRRCRVRTVVRVEDNLAAGVSLFFAEVSRIRDVVEAAADHAKPPVLFLFDEILHGTNAPDRRQATRLVLGRLLAAGSIGIVTTHDPAISDIADPPAEWSIRQAHFTDAVARVDGQVTMTFDYVMRPGPASTTNALRILEALGLGADRSR